MNTNTDSLLFPANENVCVAVGIVGLVNIVGMILWPRDESRGPEYPV